MMEHLVDLTVHGTLSDQEAISIILQLIIAGEAKTLPCLQNSNRPLCLMNTKWRRKRFDRICPWISD